MSDSNNSQQSPASKKWLPMVFGILLLALLGIGAMTWMRSISKSPQPDTEATTAALPTATVAASPLASGTPVATASGTASKADLSVDADGLSKAVIVMATSEGTIKLKLYSQDAPNTVNRFVELVQKGFYNGLTFHRVVPGFVVQGGDPTGTGAGGSGQKLKAEFNNRHHLEGTLAMARTSDPDSADSQFYITLAPQPSLDHNYTVFGQVVDGLPVIHNIKIGDKITSVTIE